MATVPVYKMLGLMSGTSGDGLDIAYCEFDYQDKWRYNLVAADTAAFPPALENSLKMAHRLGGEDLALLDLQLGKWMGRTVKQFCEGRGLRPMATASHGHTVFHQPEKAFTLQIGNGWSIYKESGYPVINDFRTPDLLQGGQGAPLVPVGDRLLFGDYDYCLNLGGIANISMETPEGRKAFDVSPFNLLLNYFAKKRGLAYDAQGLLARSGKVIPDLLAALENIAYYQREGAKSLGRETVDQTYLPLLAKFDCSVEDVSATLVEHFSLRVKAVVVNHMAAAIPAKILTTGGGAYHQFFIDRLAFHCGNQAQIIMPEEKIVNFKEALIFAFLGVLRLRREINCLKSVTGATVDTCSGTIYGYSEKKDLVN